MAELESSHAESKVLPEDLRAVSLAVLIPVKDHEVAEGPQEALSHVPYSLLVIEKVVAVNGGLAEHDLQQLQIRFVLNVDVDRLLAERAFFETVVFLLKLPDHFGMALTTFSANIVELYGCCLLRG